VGVIAHRVHVGRPIGKTKLNNRRDTKVGSDLVCVSLYSGRASERFRILFYRVLALMPTSWHWRGGWLFVAARRQTI
jgi:hypothetical protein